MSEVSEAVRMVRGDWVRFGNVQYSLHLPKNNSPCCYALQH
jgi:hypothetical protein